MKTSRHYFRSFSCFLIIIILSLNPLYTSAVAKYDPTFYAQNDILFYNPDDTSCSYVSSTSSNNDYAGNPILSDAQTQAITANQSTYQQAATQVGIPWQMLAVIHLRESGLKVENPANGQGIYQDSSAKLGDGKYPPGPVDQAGFLTQSIWAANLLKSKSTDTSSLASGVNSAVKDAFFGYNGRAAAYATQASALGYTDAFEGSPYVMNKADATRDPAVNTTTWGQIKTDGGPIVYPANNDYGAFVVYASLSGQAYSCSGGGSCGTLAATVVCLAQAELKRWQSGEMKPGFRKNDSSSFSKYTSNVDGDWCAWFVSWVLNQAGSPVKSSTTPPYWSFVEQFDTEGQQNGYVVHKNDGSYKAQPGDFGIYGNFSHINIVVGYDSSDRMLTIGGNQPDNSNPDGPVDADHNIVSQNIGYGSSATEYVTPK